MAAHHEVPSPDGEDSLPDGFMAGAGAAAVKKAKKQKKKKLGSNRGIETLFRSVYHVHMNLTTLADTKANFLISVNSLIMLLVAVHGLNYVDHKAFLYPVGIVFFACIGSIIFAVLSARPRVRKEKSPHDDESGKRMNLLFFGDYTQLPKDRFIGELEEALQATTTTYPLMMADLYEMGQVLDKKFRLLRFAYGFLLYGLPVGMVLFLVIQAMVITGRL